MKSAPKPPNEKKRQKVLDDLDILDTLPEDTYDEITKVASEICGTKIGLVSLLDHDRQWFKSHHGLDATETPREFAFCAHAIYQEEVFEISDSRKDDRFHDNPLVTGAPKVVFYAGVPLGVEEGQKVGTLCVIDDHPRELNQAQKDALKCLANQVVTQLRLRKTLKTLKEKNRSQANFITSMAHELRTPLHAVIGMSEVLQRRLTKDENLKRVDIIKSSSNILLDLIDEVLDLTKIEAGMMEPHYQYCEIHRIISQVIVTQKSNAEGKKINIESELKNLPEIISMDKTKLTQILMNLIGNAIKYSEKGTITVIVDGKDDSLFIEVSDQGLGIPEDKIDTIFDAFTQISINKKSNTQGGVGLGLSLVKKIVGLLGGHISVESKIGEGTTFKVELPYSLSEEKNPCATVDKRIEKEIQKIKVLIVEDNEINKIVTTDMLDELKIMSEVAGDQEETFKKLKEGKFEIILMDRTLPGMDGLELTKKIKQEYDVMVIGLSSDADEDHVREFFEAGIDDFISKPVSLEEFDEKIRNCLSNKKNAS